MKQEEIFEGLIDGQKFDDPIKFSEYLKEHKDAKNVSYSHSIREVEDKKPIKPIPTNPVVKESDKKTFNIYPPQFDLDELLSQKIDLEEFEKGYEAYLKDHENALEDMSDKLIEEHRDNLQQLRIQTKRQLKQNDQAISSVDSNIKRLEDIIKDCEDEICYYESKRNILDKAEEFIKIRYRALKRAITMIDQRREKIENVDKKSPLDELLSSIFNFC